MAPLYQAKTSLRHTSNQLRNRWNQLNRMYSWYKWACKQTGLGVADDGTFFAEQWWWEDNTRVFSYKYVGFNCNNYIFVVFTLLIHVFESCMQTRPECKRF